jgi:hypothetical protein
VSKGDGLAALFALIMSASVTKFMRPPVRKRYRASQLYVHLVRYENEIRSGSNHHMGRLEASPFAEGTITKRQKTSKNQTLDES